MSLHTCLPTLLKRGSIVGSVIAELADLNTHETSRNFASPLRVRVLLDLGVHVIPRLRA